MAIVHLPKLKEQAVSWACFLRWGRVPRVVANRVSSRWAATPPEPESRHATCPGLQDADDARKLLEAEGAEVLLLPYDLTEGDPTCHKIVQQVGGWVGGWVGAGGVGGWVVCREVKAGCRQVKEVSVGAAAGGAARQACWEGECALLLALLPRWGAAWQRVERPSLLLHSLSLNPPASQPACRPW